MTPKRGFMAATCAGLRFYSCYVPNGRSLDDPHYVYKLNWLESLRTLLDARDRTQPVMMGGDFNVAMSDLDVYDPAC
jgi:exodeoxyribonuclease-3